MTTKNRFRLFAFIVGGLVLAASSYNLYRLWDQPLNAWTPKYLAPEIRGVGDHVEVFVGGEPMQKLLAEGRVAVTGPLGQVVVQPSSVTVRTNNYAEQRVERAPTAIIWAGAFGASLMLLALGLIVPLLGTVISNHGQLTQLHLLHEA